MSFLALNMNTCYLMREKSDLEYQELGITNEYNEVTEELTDYLEVDGNSSDDGTAKYLQSLQEYYDTEKESIESRLEVLNAEVESFQKAVQTNIKTECKLTISV